MARPDKRASGPARSRMLRIAASVLGEVGEREHAAPDPPAAVDDLLTTNAAL